MAKDAPAEVQKSEPSRLEKLRAQFSDLQKRVPDLKLVRVEPSAELERKGHVLATWGRTRVAHVVEPPHTIDDAECAVLEVTIANLSRS